MVACTLLQFTIVALDCKEVLLKRQRLMLEAFAQHNLFIGRQHRQVRYSSQHRRNLNHSVRAGGGNIRIWTHSRDRGSVDACTFELYEIRYFRNITLGKTPATCVERRLAA